MPLITSYHRYALNIRAQQTRQIRKAAGASIRNCKAIIGRPIPYDINEKHYATVVSPFLTNEQRQTINKSMIEEVAGSIYRKIATALEKKEKC